jgi:hypothetical protein
MAAVVHLEPRFDQPRPAPRLRLVEPVRQPRPRPARRASHAVYRRRRVLAALVGLGLVLAVARAGGAFGDPSLAVPEHLPHVQQIVVEPGDTFWSIAQRIDPGHDPRPLVDAMIDAHGSATLRAGEMLTVPAP